MIPAVTGQEVELSALICEHRSSFLRRKAFDPLPSQGQLWFMWPSWTRWRPVLRGEGRPTPPTSMWIFTDKNSRGGYDVQSGSEGSDL